MIEAAHAILLLGDRYVLQLRDNKPDISCPNQWGLFGGHLEPGEDPATAVRREIQEELSIAAEDWRALGRIELFGEFERQPLRLWIFRARVDASWNTRDLKEGQDAQAFAFEELDSLDIPPAFRREIEGFHSQCRPIARP